MKTNRLNWEYRSNASKLHRAVGEALRAENSPFSGFKIYQEYPVSKIYPQYPNAAHKFDWVVLDLAIIIEAHGKQHYVATSFGSGGGDLQESFRAQKDRDNAKMQAAVDAGFTYIVVSYDEEKKVTPTFLWNKYKEMYNPEPIEKSEDSPPEKLDLAHQQRLETARKYRKEQYQRQKEFLNRLKQEKKDGLQTSGYQKYDS